LPFITFLPRICVEDLLPSYGSIQIFPQSEFPLFYEDPDDWTPSESVKKASCRFIGSRPVFYDSHFHDATILLPRDVSAPAPSLHLLGSEMMSERVSTRDTSPFRFPLQRADRQIEWTRYILLSERDVLRSAGVYDMIYLSLFHYSVDDSLLQAFSERWSYTTNTLFLDDREMTLTLWELRQLIGLPIVGHYYDEFLISDSDLEDSDRFPVSLRTIFRIYITLRGRFSHVPFRRWISHFTAGCTDPVFEGSVPVDDPLGIGIPTVHLTGGPPS
jgi:hypothetical protein